MNSPFDTSNGGKSTSEEKRPEAGSPNPHRRESRLLPGGVKEVALLAYPVVLSQLSVTLMGVVDAAMVGRLGPVELAAVGFGGNWMWTLFCFFIGVIYLDLRFIRRKLWQGLYPLCWR